METETKTFTFYSDPGHGWLEVDKKDLIELSLEDKISSFSYQSALENKVYLEEDCDATLFWKSYEAKYKTAMKHREIYIEDNIFIRRLPSYERR